MRIQSKIHQICTIVAISIAIASCNNTDSGKFSSQASVISYKGEIKKVDVSEYFTPLPPFCIETTDDALLSRLSRVLETTDGYYVLDMKGWSVINITKDGKIRHVISAVGTGPLEYKKINDIAWDDANKRLILLALDKILFADSEGKIYESHNMETYYKFIVADNDNILISNSTFVNGEMSNSQLAVVDKDWKVTSFMSPLPEYAPYCMVNGPELTKAGDKIYFIRKFDNSIYTVATGSESCDYIIDWGDSMFNPEDGVEYDCIELSKQCEERRLVYSMSDLQAGKDFISFKTNLTGVNLMSKKDSTVFLVKGLYDERFGFNLPNYTPVEGKSGIVFFEVPARIFLMMAEKSEKEMVKSLASGLTMESNPVIIPFVLK